MTEQTRTSHGQGNLPSNGPSASPGENAQRDIGSADTIQRRSAELHDYRDNSMSREQARMAVREDLETLGKINGAMEHRTALGTLGRMSGAQAEYKDELRDQNPGVANEAESTALRDREKVAAAQGEYRASPEGQARAVEGEALRVAVGQAEAKHDEWRAGRSYAERAADVDVQVGAEGAHVSGPRGDASNEPAKEADMSEQSIGGATGNQMEADGLKSIESRAEARRVAEQKGDPQQWVQADLRDFARLPERWQQEHAGVVMAENIRSDAAYKTALTKEAPEMVVRVQELDAANDDKVWAKEDRKNEAYATGKREEAESAQRWTPEQAAALAVTHAKELRQTQDVTERHYAGEDMAVNARNSPAYRAGLEAQAQDVAKELAERHKEALGSVTAARAVANDPTAPRADSDERNLQGIEDRQRRARSDERADQAYERAATDAAAFARIQGKSTKVLAADMMVSSTERSDDYQHALRTQTPEVAAEVSGIDRTSRRDALEAVGSATAARAAANDPSAPRADAANDAVRGPTLAIDAATMERLQQARARDSQQAAEALGLNGIELTSERRRQALNADEQAERDGAVRKVGDAQRRPSDRERAPTDNKVESDEVFTASQADTKAVVPPEVERQYRRDGSKYYELAKPEVVAFEDKGNKLETRSNSEQVAENLVRIAKARGWDEIKVSGSEAFRKEAWLEAAANGMHVKGYTPSEQDKEALAKRSQTEATRVENEGKPFCGREAEGTPDQTQGTAVQSRARAFATDKQADAIKAHPELVGAYVATAAVERKAEADGLTIEQRAVVASRVRQNVVNAIERGDVPEAQLNDRLELRRDRDRQDEREVS
ncbi:MAG: hypothetical protein H7255_04310, partial [Ramlibacter sp.]|nr:hypothetical protein [Ramlibacter sp.]